MKKRVGVVSSRLLLCASLLLSCSYQPFALAKTQSAQDKESLKKLFGKEKSLPALPEGFTTRSEVSVEQENATADATQAEQPKPTTSVTPEQVDQAVENLEQAVDLLKPVEQVITENNLIGAVSQQVLEAVQNDGELVEALLEEADELEENYDPSAPRKEYTRFNQPFAFFHSVGKYPMLMKFDPRTGVTDLVNCGYEDQSSGSTSLVTQAEHLVDLKPVWTFQKYAYLPGLQVEKKFQGQREAVLGQMLESIFVKGEYKGTVLLDEYNAGLPMKWVLKDEGHLASVVQYLKKNGIVKRAEKPVLLLEMVNEISSMHDNSDIKFLKKYYHLLTTEDLSPEARKFYKHCDDKLQDVIEATKDATTVGKGYVDKILDDLEKEFGAFKGQNITSKVVKTTTVLLSVFIIYKLSEKLVDTFIVSPIHKKICELAGK